MLDIKDLTPKEAMRLAKGMTPDRFLNLLMDYVDNGKYTEEDAIGMFVRAYLDSKTGLWNSESLHSGIAEYIDDARSGKREDKGISVIFGDLDGFKKFNDTYGHGKGDYVLEQFGHVLDRTRRETDKRYKCHRNGGDEFVVVLFGADERGVEAFRERLTKNIKKRKDAFYRAVEGDPESIGFLYSKGVSLDGFYKDLEGLNTSLGSASLSGEELGSGLTSVELAEKIISMADASMYADKKGRNKDYAEGLYPEYLGKGISPYQAYASQMAGIAPKGSNLDTFV